jgi:hypothetical protein
MPVLHILLDSMHYLLLTPTEIISDTCQHISSTCNTCLSFLLLPTLLQAVLTSFISSLSSAALIGNSRLNTKHSSLFCNRGMFIIYIHIIQCITLIDIYLHEELLSFTEFLFITSELLQHVNLSSNVMQRQDYLQYLFRRWS